MLHSRGDVLTPATAMDAPPRPVVASLHFVARHLGVSAVALYVSAPDGHLAEWAAVGADASSADWRRRLAEAAEPGLIEYREAGAAFAASVRVDRDVLLVWGDAPPAGDWRPRFQHDADLVIGLLRTPVGPDGTTRPLPHDATLAAFFAGAPVGMGTVRLVRHDGAEDLEIRSISARAAAFFQAEPEALVGRSLASLGVAAPVRQRWVGACCRATSTGAEQVEVAVRRGGDRQFVTTVVRVEGPHPDFAFVTEDVTAVRHVAGRLRQRDAQVEAIVAQASVALFTTDRFGRVTASRGQAAAALGLDAAHGTSLGDLFASIPEAAACVLRAHEGLESAWRVCPGDRCFECRVLPTHDDAGEFAGLVGVVLDVTEQERSTQALAHATQSLEAAAGVRSEFLKHIDREIRSPLTSILGYADLLHEGTPPEEVVQARDVIARSGSRLLEALDELLDLALLDSENVTVTPVPADVRAIVERAIETSRTAAEAQRLTLRLEYALPDVPLLLDGKLLERVVRHLIGGAIASAPMGARVEIDVEAVRGQVEISVRGGSGDAGPVGTSLVHRLVGAMGGTSEQTAGDVPRWTVRLPRRAVPVVDLGSDGGAGAPPVPAPPSRVAGEGPSVAGVPVTG